MKYFSMFSGIGGFEYGIQRATKEIDNNIRPLQQKNTKRPAEHHDAQNKLLKWECVGYSEINRQAIWVYKKHFPTHKNYGDATKIVPRELPDFDFLVAGFPCQPFSIAGKRRGFDDTRGTLFFDIARVLKDKRPRYFLLENVKGLLSNKKGKTFQTILKVLADLGYGVEWQVLNSKDFGVPQNRERVFIIGYLRGESRPKVFYPWEVVAVYNESQKDKKRILSHNQEAKTLTARRYASWNGNFVGETKLRQISRISEKDALSGGVDTKNGLYVVNGSIRRLTPLECERLQGFPDGWTEGVSDAQRYKLLGNAVTVNVVEFIIRRLKWIGR